MANESAFEKYYNFNLMNIILMKAVISTAETSKNFL